MKMHFILLALVIYLLPVGNTFGNHTTFGFCYDSLNSLNFSEFNEFSGS